MNTFNGRAWKGLATNYVADPTGTYSPLHSNSNFIKMLML